MSVHGENQLICAMFQTVTVFKIKIKLWQEEVMANNCTHFDTLAKHRAQNSEEYAAMTSILIKEFASRITE